MGSGFVLNRGMESRFSGRDGELSLDGGVRTTMFGANYSKGPLMAGLMLSHRCGCAPARPGRLPGGLVGHGASPATISTCQIRVVALATFL